MYLPKYLSNKTIVKAKTTCGIRAVCTVRSLCRCIRIIVFIFGIGALQEAQAQGYVDNPAYAMPLGPIPIRDARPYNMLFLQFVPETGDILPLRANRFDIQLDLIIDV